MTRKFNIALTSIAPIIWGSTYFVTTEFLPPDYPFTVAMLRALPIGLLLLLVVRQLPTGFWWPKIFVLGALNFSIFWSMLFISAYRLPGGVAAILGATQPLIVIVLARILLGCPIRLLNLTAAMIGIGGVTLLILTPKAALDPMGIAAGFIGAISMALGTVLSRRWQAKVPLLTFTSWQLVAGGLLLLPVSMWFEPSLPALTQGNLIGFIYLSLIGAGLTYILWFRGVSKLEPASVSMLGFLSPITAVTIGWLLLGQSLNFIQCIAVITVLISVWLGQFASRPLLKRS